MEAAAGSAAPSFDLLKQIITVVIPILTPVLIDGVKRVVSKIPPNLLPIIAPIVGAVIVLIGNALGIESFKEIGITEGAFLGSAGVGIREIVNQNITKRKIPTSDQPTGPTGTEEPPPPPPQ